MSIKEIQKKYGDGVLMDASFLLEEEKVVIPISPSIDIHLRGGIAEGTIATFSGQSGTGKSTTGLQIAANAQRKEYGSRKIFYDDVEHRLKKSNLQGIRGLDCSPERFQVIRSTKEKILSAEDHLNIVLELIKQYPQSVFIIDSASALCGLSEMSDDVKSDFRNNSPKLMANFCRHIAPIVLLNKQIVIITQHMIADTSGRSMGSGYHEDGGNKIKHGSDIRMRIKWTEKWTAGSGENERRIGQILHWQIIKSPYGEIDKVDSYLRYGVGLDECTEIIILACDLGLITKGGAWFTFNFLEESVKVQGQEKVYDWLVSHPEEYQTLYKMVKDSVKS